MLKRSLSLAAWLGICFLPLSLYYSSFYAPSFSASPWYATVTFLCAAAGHFFLYFFLVALVLVTPVWLFVKQPGKIILLWTWLVVFLASLVLAVDAHVFALYRFHINLAMLDLFFNAGGEVIAFSVNTWLSIGLELILLVAGSMFLTWLAFRLLRQGVRLGSLVWLLCLCYIQANITHAFCAAKGILPVTEIASRLPVYKPLTANSLFIKTGFVSKQEIADRKVTLSSQGFFDYPKNPLRYQAPPEKLNVLFLLVDALRADMLTPEVMPHTWAYAQQAWRFTNSYSASNSTRGGIFGLFYGLPPSYWQVALSSGIPAGLIQAVRANDYRLGVFTSATVYKPEFNQTVFSGEQNLRIHSEGRTVFEKDLNAIADFKTFTRSLNGQPFFSFIFLDNVHSTACPEDFPHPFKPYLKEVNHMELNADTDREPYFNLYKNASYYADSNVQQVLTFLEEEGLADNTVVVISADHGEEFNDNGDNYWGHNSNFTDAQIKVPLVVKWPGMGSGVQDLPVVSYDVSATIMPRVFGVTNPVSDFSVGQDLFKVKPIDYFLVGSYLENAVVEQNRIVVIDKLGMLQFKNKDYSDSSDTKRSRHLLEALGTFSYYLGGDK